MSDQPTEDRAEKTWSIAFCYVLVFVLACCSAPIAFHIEGARETNELMRTAPHDGLAGLSVLMGSILAAVVAFFTIVVAGVILVKTIESKRR